MYFYTNQNNGVRAYIRRDHAKDYGDLWAASKDPFLYGIPVFTFVDADRLRRNPEQRRFFTGTYEFADRLLTGHVICQIDRNCPWDGFVPFSNQDFKDERYLTTPENVVRAFGLLSDYGQRIL